MGNPGTFGDAVYLKFDGDITEAFEEMASSAEQNGNEVKLKCVEKSGSHALLDGSSTMKSYIFARCCSPCLFNSRFETVSDEMKNRTLSHIVFTWVMGEDEDGHLEGRLRPPQSLGMLITVTSHDEGTGAFELRAQDLVGGELVSVSNIMREPAVQNCASATHGIICTRVQAGVEPVN